jgi:lipoate-protein ligase B
MPERLVEPDQPKPAWVCHLGLMDYARSLVLQQRLMQLRFEGCIDDILLVLQHPPTVTLGRFGKKENLLVSEPELEGQGIVFCRTDRGGDITFHCPGQLIIYPIMDLRKRKGRLRDFLTRIEEAAIKTLGFYGVEAERWSEHPGIWVRGKQIGAVGLRISRGISMHGLSLNVNPALSRFKVINLCGLPGMEATSIAELTGKPVTVAGVRKKLEKNFSEVFNTKLMEISAKQVKEDSAAALTLAAVV